MKKKSYRFYWKNKLNNQYTKIKYFSLKNRGKIENFPIQIDHISSVYLLIRKKITCGFARGFFQQKIGTHKFHSFVVHLRWQILDPERRYASVGQGTSPFEPVPHLRVLQISRPGPHHGLCLRQRKFFDGILQECSQLDVPRKTEESLADKFDWNRCRVSSLDTHARVYVCTEWLKIFKGFQFEMVEVC